MKNIFLLIVLATTAIFYSCSNEVDFGEQYKKMVYIVNSKEMLHYASHEASENSKGRISVYVTGSELPTNDIHVSYKVNEDVLKTYNQKEYGDRTDLYFSLIPNDLYTFQESEIIIKKGEPYGCLNFTINTQKLPSNNVYILPISIVSANGVQIHESMHTILYVIQVQNVYAGDYISDCKMDNIGKGQIKKKVTALSTQKILLPLSNISNVNVPSNKPLDENTDFYQVTVNEDNSLTLNPYLNSYIQQNPKKKSYYDPVERIFYIYYIVQDKYEVPVVVEEVLKLI